MVVDTQKLQEEELASLQENDDANDEELTVYDLEKLILAGKDAKIPVEIEYPTKDGKTAKVGAYLKPLTDVETQNALRSAKKNKGTTFRIELLKRGLYNLDGEPFKAELIKMMYSGVIASLADKLSELSGASMDTDKQKELMDSLMGF